MSKCITWLTLVFNVVLHVSVLAQQGPSGHSEPVYSPARSANGFTFVSGQIGVSPVTRKLVNSSFRDQAVQALTNIRAILKSEGLGMADVISATVFLKDISRYDEMNTIYSGYFSSPLPARVTVSVTSLPQDAEIEIAVVAVNR